jgi:hypothetical protein
MDCTVCNYTPFKYAELKPGQVPDMYIIPSAQGNNDELPGILHVKNTHANLYMPLQEYTYRVPIPGDDLADDLVKSLISAKLCYEMNVAEPGIFWLEGHHSAYVVNKDFKSKVDDALQKQHVWLERLVKLGDDDWQKYRQHKFITEVQRWAAKKLGFKKEWAAIAPNAPVETTNCPYCGTLTFKGIAVCPNCKQVIDPVLYKQIQVNMENQLTAVKS